MKYNSYFQLPVSENAAKFDKRKRSQYSVIRCSANDYTPLLKSRRKFFYHMSQLFLQFADVDNLVYEFVESTTELTHSTVADQQHNRMTASQNTQGSGDVHITYFTMDTDDDDIHDDDEEVYADAIIETFPLDSDSIHDVSTRTYKTL